MVVDLLQAVILGIVQGLTEWLPISSSGHLALLQLAMGLKVPVFFDLILHVGSLAGVFAIYRKDIVSIISSMVWYVCYRIVPRNSNKISSHNHLRRQQEEQQNHADIQLIILIIIGMIPTAIIGIVFRSFFEFSFYDTTSIATGFIVTGFFVIVTRFLKNGYKRIENSDAFLIGIGQGLSIFSSISRSGATISVGMFRGLDKDNLVKYSFLLSIPAILGASIFDMITADRDTLSQMDDISIMSYFVGIFASALVGYGSIKFLIKAINKGSFYMFSFYCFAIGFATFIIL
ncbi:MAG TPA: undecaprenyl-diphosphate phosphatase [Nitrososphaeraceae archaeon]